jgi:predicted acetyltransferase
VLENASGEPVSSLILYQLDQVNGMPAIGIGSIATVPSDRLKGRAGQLLWEVMTLFHERDGSRVFYLHADINPKFYEKFEFIKLPDKFQLKEGSTTMIRCQKEIREKLLTGTDFQPPTYF